jgi:hypothetical protein
MGAAVRVPIHFLGGVFNPNALGFKIIDPFLELFLGAHELHHHNPFPPGKDFGIQDIEKKAEVLYEVGDNGFVNLGLRKSKNENSRIHGGPPKIDLYLRKNFIF